MSQQIASFFAKIEADSSQFIAEAKKTQQQMDALKSKLNEAGVSQQAYNKTVADAKRAYMDQQKGAADAAKGTDGLMASIKGLINPTTMAMAAVTGLAVYLKNATAAAAESAQVDAKLQAVLKSTGSAAGLSADQLDEMATTLSKMSGADDEAVKSAEAVMLTFRQIGSEVFPQAMQAALDMSAVMGQDLQSSVVQIGKALNDPIAGVSALQRVGVQLTDQQKEQIQTFMAAGDVMSAQGVILSELNAEFGGAAEAINSAGDGSENLRVAFGNLAEAIGSTLLPATREGKQSLTEWLDSFSSAIDKASELKASLGEVNPELTNLSRVSGTGKQKLEDLAKAYDALASNRAMADLRDDWTGLSETMNRSAPVFIDSLSEIQSVVGGPLLKAQQDYNAKIAEYRDLLSEAKKQKDKDEINANIAAETAAYRERAAAIVFNIQQEQILNSDMPDNKKAEAIAALGQATGQYDQATASAIVTTQYWTDQLAQGNITAEDYANKLKYTQDNAYALASAQDTAAASAGVLAGNLAPASAQMAQLAGKTENLTGRMGDAADTAPDTAEGIQGIGEAASEAHGPLNNVAMDLGKLPPSGTNWSYGIKISVSGKVPNLGGLGGESGHVSCFRAGTPVTLADGTIRPIEEVEVGDQVLAYDVARGEFLPARVSFLIRHDSSEHLAIDDLHITAEHPVWVVGRRAWVRADDVRLGDVLLTDQGHTRTVRSIVRIHQDVPVYNLTVEGVHTYFAGGVLVHNKVVGNEDLSPSTGASGGQLTGKDYVIVGDNASGWSPTAEVITPSGRILDHKTSQAMKDAGLLEGAVPMMFGTEDGFSGGESAVYLRTQKKKKSSSGTTTARTGKNKGDVAIAVPNIARSMGALAASSQEEAGHASIVSARAMVAMTEQTNALQAKTNALLTQILGKVASDEGIARSVGVQDAKYS